jgi:hypothetical protein
LNRAERELGADGSALVHEILILGMTMDQVGRRRDYGPSGGTTISRCDSANASIGWH